MKTTIASLLALIVFYSPAPAGAADEATAQAARSSAVTLEALSLADACKMVVLMNDDKWDEVEQALGTKEGMIALLRADARRKDWAGIGAYRGTETDEGSRRRVIHRFGFSPRTSPHEIWLIYTFTESGISKPSLMVMGW